MVNYGIFYSIYLDKLKFYQDFKKLQGVNYTIKRKIKPRPHSPDKTRKDLLSFRGILIIFKYKNIIDFLLMLQ